MSSRHLVDPDLVPMLDELSKFMVDNETLAEVRRNMFPMPLPSDDIVAASTVQRVSVSGPQDAPDVDVLLYLPVKRQAPLSCIFHIHGGGFVMGTAETMAGTHRRLVSELGCAIVTVDYRVAPETRFPGGIEDCYAALRWLFAEAEGLGIDTGRIGVMGESAGGGYAAAFAVLVRDRKEFSLSFQQLICPMLDDRTCTTEEPNRFAGEFGWTPEANAFGWRALLGCDPGSPEVSPYASAARAEDLTDLPPTFIAVGALDLFVDENAKYATRLIRAGVATELHIYPGGFHGFDMVADSAIAKQSQHDSLAALRRFLA